MIHHLLFSALLVLSSCNKGDVKRGLPFWSEDTELSESSQSSRIFVTPDLRYAVFLTKSTDGSSDRLSPVKVALNNDAIPTFRVEASASGNIYQYDYVVNNARAAKDSIFGVSIIAPAFLPGTNASYVPKTPDGRRWDGVVNFTVFEAPSEIGDHVKGRVILWMPHGDSEQLDAGKLNIQPGQTVGNLRISSPLLPGFTTAKTSGLPYAPPEGVIDDDGVGRQLVRLDDYFETTTLTLGPMFLPGTTFPDIVANYRAGIARLNQCDGVSHARGFLGELDGVLQEDGIDTKLADRLDHMESRPMAPIEAELMNCLRLIADSLTHNSRGK